MENKLRTEAEKVLTNQILRDYKHVPSSDKTDFQKNKDCPARITALTAMLDFHAQESKKDNWVSIKDKLPDSYHGRVLVWVKEINDLGISEYCWNCSYSELHGFTDELKTYTVTHWQPLPNNPNTTQQ